MAEFCLKCWREMFEKADDPYEDDEFDTWEDICEGCGEIKLCVWPKKGIIARMKHKARRKRRQKENL